MKIGDFMKKRVAIWEIVLAVFVVLVSVFVLIGVWKSATANFKDLQIQNYQGVLIKSAKELPKSVETFNTAEEAYQSPIVLVNKLESEKWTINMSFVTAGEEEKVLTVKSGLNVTEDRQVSKEKGYFEYVYENVYFAVKVE